MRLKGPASRRNNIITVRLSEPPFSTSNMCKYATKPSHQVSILKPSFWLCPSPRRGIFCLTFQVDRALQRIRHLFHRSPVQSQDRRLANETCSRTTRLKTHSLIYFVQQHLSYQHMRRMRRRHLVTLHRLDIVLTVS
ncbi:hypothetical protein HBI18_214100 [Parastagonospora nodorum]|nr:hypothetical protein HBI06_166590 [Parastagonospora nodorum]KAH4237275.1 hypothetical protein HBI05_129010 [Parastagonospora nodorum]KAH5185541.1 hypothetical protein HBH76_125890 [Parastagonospora nodorum]KAH5698123.1 hypothetical protein HBI44_085930 [Parastagonospora nodorum]KAH5712003.1 hypothetical protein HBI18_214100 [Parastagonospora nodorum]